MDERHSELDAGRLITLLTEQRELYRRLRVLSERQRSLISGDQPEQLLTILQDRQSLIAALTSLNVQLAPYRREWEGMYQGLSEDARKQTSDLLGEINDLLRVILKTDHEDSTLLAARKQSVARDLSGIADGKLAGGAYAQQARPGRSKHSADLTG